MAPWSTGRRRASGSTELSSAAPFWTEAEAQAALKEAHGRWADGGRSLCGPPRYPSEPAARPWQFARTHPHGRSNLRTPQATPRKRRPLKQSSQKGRPSPGSARKNTERTFIVSEKIHQANVYRPERQALTLLKTKAFRGARKRSMYVYDEFDRTFIAERAAQFRDQVTRRLFCELSEDEFRPLRLMNGVYLQLHAYMLRIAIPYGTLVFVISYAKIAPRSTGLRPRLRTFHDTAEPPAQLDQAFGPCRISSGSWQEVGLHADPNLRQLHPQHHHRSMGRRCPGRDRGPAHLGRNPAPMVHAAPGIHLPAAQIQDSRSWPRRRTARRSKSTISACILITNAQGETQDLRFLLAADCSWGARHLWPRLSAHFLPKHDLLSYLEAVLRIYNAYGRRDNIYKARINILSPHSWSRTPGRRGGRRMGANQGWLPEARSGTRCRAIRSHFVYPDYEALRERAGRRSRRN